MLGGIKNNKTDCFIRVYLIAMNVLLEYLNINKKILHRYHDITIYIDTIDYIVATLIVLYLIIQKVTRLSMTYTLDKMLSLHNAVQGNQFTNVCFAWVLTNQEFLYYELLPQLNICNCR